MTELQKRQIKTLRTGGKGCSEIAKLVGLSVASVKMYCSRNGIKPPESKQVSKCLNCGASLSMRDRGRKRLFCSDRCRVNYWRRNEVAAAIHERTCAFCGRTFATYDLKRKYCSHECYINDRFGKGDR